MSGSSIGSVVGFVVGNLIFPGLGGAIGNVLGGAIGASFDRTTIDGPNIGDAQTQTSQAGVPRPIVFGHTPPFAGNHMDGETKARKVITEEEQGGKGGGPTTVQKTEHFYITYAIRICEGPISGVLRIKRQGKPVYDVRPLEAIPGWDDPDTEEAVAQYFEEMQAANTKFLANHRIYLGDEDQLPDPALEMLHGVGNTPYYRGTAYMVGEDEEVTDVGGAVAKFDFEVISCGDTPESLPYLAVSGGIADSQYRSADGHAYTLETAALGGAPGETLRFVCANASTVVGISTAGNFWYSDEFGAPGTWVQATGAANTGAQEIVYGNGRFVCLGVEAGVSADNGRTWVTSPAIGFDVPNCITFGLGNFLASGGNTGAGIYYSADGILWTLAIAGGFAGVGFNGEGFMAFSGSTPYYSSNVLTWDAKTAPVGLSACYAVIGGPGYWLAGDFGSTGIYRSVSNGAGWTLVQATATTFFSAFRIGSQIIMGQGGGGSIGDWVSDDEGATWALQTFSGGLGQPASHARTGAQAGFIPIPDAPDATVDPITGEVTVESGAAALLEYCGDLTLQEVEEAIAARCNVPTGRFDASALSGITIPGYLIARQATGADCLRPLCQAYFHDLPEPDGIVAVLRGEASQGEITDDDLLLEDSDPFTTGQALEYPLKVSVITQHPEADYAPIPQTSERYSPDVRASSEVSITVPVPMSADEAMAVAVKIHNVLWAQVEGNEELPLSRKHGHLMVSDAITRNSRRWLITQSNRADRQNRLKVVYDRESSYHTVTTGTTPPPPTPAGSGLIGPTRFEWLNLPILADSHDKVGFYIAGKGMFSAWAGGVIQASIDSGVSWAEIGLVESASVMGHIETALPDAMAEVIDDVDTVRVNVGRGSLDNITLEQLLYEFNACVIGDEICQFETATYVSDGVYDLTGLTRGRLDTEAEAHVAFERFVLLNAPVFCEVPTSWIGRTLLIRVVSNGTAAAENASESVTWSPAVIQTEWAPNYLVTSRDVSNNVSIAWTGRARLGTNAAPVHSVNFLGYRLRITKGATTVEKAITAAQSYSYTATEQTADFGSATGTIDVAIAAMNRITGASAELTGSIA